jgi:hypothetical protein
MTIIIKVGETEKLRFEPHLVGNDFVITPRRGRRFPIPIGSNVYDGDEFLGVVIFMVPEQFQRCRVVFEPPVAEVPDEDAMLDVDALRDEERIREAQQQLDEMTMRPEWASTHGPPLAGDTVVSADERRDVPLAGSIAELELSDRLLDVLESHGLVRLQALQSALSQGDVFMLSLAGIGPKSLDQIKGALEQAKGALDPVEMPDARLDG